MRARIREPGESLRWFFYVLSAICFLAAGIFRIEIGPPLDPVFFAGAALLFMSPIFRQRTAWRNAEIEAHPGRLDISRQGIFTKRESTLAIKNLIGASIARVEGNMNLALAVGSGARHPVVIEFENDGDAKVATSSLGIGQNGFGVVVWERAPTFLQRSVLAIRIVATLYCFAIGTAAAVSDPIAANLDLRHIETLLVVGALGVVFFAPLVIARRTLSLTSDAAVMFEDRIRTLRYGTIATIRLENSQFVIDRVVDENDARGDLLTARVPFSKRTPFLPGLDDVDTTLIVEHVTAAAERARHGMKSEPHEQVRTLLGRRDRETTEQWVRRIDELGESWRTSPPRYGESIDIKHALWAAVEDHDCNETLRALAARLLAKLDPANAPPRILRVADATRAPRQASQIRIALEAEVEPMAKSIAGNSKR